MDSATIDNVLDLDPYLLFVNSIRSPLTRQKYFGRLNSFFDFIQLPEGPLDERCRTFIKNCNENTNYSLNCTYRFVIHLKGKMEKNEIVVSTIFNYLKPIKLLCDINDIQVKWKKITIGLPKERKYAEDRSPTIEEVQSLVKYPDRRLKVIVSIMISSGIRLAAWDDLKFKHIQPIEKNGQIVAARIIVYPGSEEQYYSFITPEAYNTLNDWMDYRKNNGETITGDSWVLRNLWDVTTPSGGPRGLVSIPKKLKHTGVKSLMERALRAQGIRSQLEEGRKRYPFATDHGLRKFFKTRCEMAGMKSINIEILMNHSTGISDSYYRPQENEILEDYLKAIDGLTINKNNSDILEMEIKELQEKDENREYMISSKLGERDDVINALSDQVMQLMNDLQELKNDKTKK